MKQSNSPTRTFLSLFAFAAIGCSPLVSSQPGVPPIEMTIEQFNQGRPADFYYLADASQGYEAVCAEVLAALNEPYPGEPYAEYKEPYSKYLLRSRLSVPWVEMPNYGLSNDRQSWDLRYARFDFNNDSAEEDILVTINNLSSQPVHTFGIAEVGLLPDGILELTYAQRRVLIEAESFARGRAIREQIAREIWKTYGEYDVNKPDSLMVFDPFLDVVQIENRHYFLVTNSGPYARTRDAFLFDVHSDYTISPACRLVSRYSVVR